MASILTPITDPDKLMEEEVYADVSFANANPDTITRADGTAFDALTLTYGDSDYVTVRGSTQNDGTYQIASVTATVITLKNNEQLTADANDAATLYFFKVDDTNGRFDTDAIHIDAVSKTFYFKGAGNLATGGSGVTGQALYSFFKDLWANVTEITKYDFPMLSITNEQFEFIDDWTPDDGFIIVDEADDIDFDTTADTIDSAGAYDFTEYFKAGDVIKVTTTSTTNDGTYTVTAVTATSISVAEDLTTEAAATAGTVTLQSNVVEQSGSFDTSTRKAIRTAGWSEVSGAGVALERYSGIISLGTLGTTDQPYFAQSSSLTAETTNTVYTGAVNEAVKIYAYTGSATDIAFDTTNDSITSTTTDLSVFNVGDSIVVDTTSNTNDGTYTVTEVLGPYEIRVDSNLTTENAATAGATTITTDYTSYFAIYVREAKKLYATADLADIGVTTMTYIVYRFPVANATDLNIPTDWVDTDIDANVFEVSLADLDFTSATTVQSATTGAFTGFTATDLIKIVGSSSNDGFYEISSVTTTTVTDDTITISQSGAFTGSAFNVVDDTGLTITVTEDAVADVSPYDVVWVEYLNKNILGYVQDTTYAIDDVVQETINGSNGTGRWYICTGAGTVTGSSGVVQGSWGGTATWTAWDKASGGGEREVESGIYSAYNIIIDGNNTITDNTSPYTNASGSSKETVYRWAQWALRQSTFIDTGASQNGNIADSFVEFVGSTLETLDSVFVDDLLSSDANNIVFNDWEGNPHTYPLTVTVTINFNSNLTGDPDAIFYAYYTDPVNDITGGDGDAGGGVVTDTSQNYPAGGLVNLYGIVTGTTGGTNDGTYQVSANTATTVTFTGLTTSSESGTINVEFFGNEFGTTGATQVVISGGSQNVGADLTPPNNVATAGASYGFQYDYDGDTTAGRTVSTDVNITVVAIGLSTGQYVSASGNITTSGGTISLVAPLERNYANPS